MSRIPEKVETTSPLLRTLGIKSLKDLLLVDPVITRMASVKTPYSSYGIRGDWASRIVSTMLAIGANSTRTWKYTFQTKSFVETVKVKFSTYVEGDYYSIKRLSSADAVLETLSDKIYARSSTQTTSIKKEFEEGQKIQIVSYAKTSAQTFFGELAFFSKSGSYTEGEPDPVSEDTWTTMTVLTTARDSLCSFEIGGVIYCMPGDVSNYKHNEAYTISADTWATKTDCSVARLSGAASATESGAKGHFMGGYSAGMLDTNEQYCPTGNDWTAKTILNTAANYQTASMLSELIYLIGGQDASYDAENQIEAYSGVTNAWTVKINMFVAGMGCGSSPYVDDIYIVGGTGDTDRNTKFNPDDNSITAKTSLTTASYHLGAFTLNDKIYATGGHDGASNVSHQEYNPAANTWQAKTDLTTGREKLAVDGDAVDYGFAIGGDSSSKNENERYQ